MTNTRNVPMMILRYIDPASNGDVSDNDDVVDSSRTLSSFSSLTIGDAITAQKINAFSCRIKQQKILRFWEQFPKQIAQIETKPKIPKQLANQRDNNRFVE